MGIINKLVIDNKKKDLKISMYQVTAWTNTYGGRFPAKMKYKSFQSEEKALEWASKQQALKSVQHVRVSFFYAEPTNGPDHREAGAVWHGELGTYLYSANY